MVKIFGQVNHQQGLTSRMCAELVAEANRASSCNLTLYSNDEEADLKSIMNMMSLPMHHEQEFTIEIVGADEEAVKTKFEELLRKLNLLN